jgi:pyruvate dehydrogenase E2 component (dihydrolipoamide acetyltransferase)
MAEFRMPSLGSDMEKGTLVEWLKKPGERVAPGDIIAVIETDKGAIEIESFQAGVFERSLVEIGATVPVGTPIAIIDGGGPAAAAPAPVEKPKPTPPPAPAAPPPKPVAPAPAPSLKVSPAARKLAAERGVDLATLKGSGPEGSIVYIDVEAALSAKPQPAPAPAKKKAGIDAAAMRGVIAAATARAKREIPHYYLTHDVDITAMLAKLTRLNAKRTPDRRVLAAAVFVKALADALRKHPGFNGFYTDGAVRAAERVNVGVAVALRGGGLVAPAIHDTDKLSLDEVMAALRDLVERVRAGRFRSSELSDPTITLTSLGDRGVDMVVPVIYPPQVAIAGAGTPRLRPWIVGGKVKARTVVTLSLAGDHRAGDGHQGALFLATWADFLQDAKRL